MDLQSVHGSHERFGQPLRWDFVRHCLESRSFIDSGASQAQIQQARDDDGSRNDTEMCLRRPDALIENQ